MFPFLLDFGFGYVGAVLVLVEKMSKEIKLE